MKNLLMSGSEVADCFLSALQTCLRNYSVLKSSKACKRPSAEAVFGLFSAAVGMCTNPLEKDLLLVEIRQNYNGTRFHVIILDMEDIISNSKQFLLKTIFFQPFRKPVAYKQVLNFHKRNYCCLLTCQRIPL